jgi:type III secretory pathway component EscS
MIEGVLKIKFIPNIIMVIFGWIVIATTLVGVIISLMRVILKTS